MFGKSIEQKRAKVEQRALPVGCQGRIGTRVETTDGSGSRITTTLGCAGLLEGLVDVSTNEYIFADTMAGRRKQHLDSIANAAAQLTNACAGCHLGAAGQERQRAKELQASPDDLATKLQIAEAERATAEAELEIERLRRSPDNQD